MQDKTEILAMVSDFAAKMQGEMIRPKNLKKRSWRKLPGITTADRIENFAIELGENMRAEDFGEPYSKKESKQFCIHIANYAMMLHDVLSREGK